MRKQITKCLVYVLTVAMIVTLLPVNQLTVRAEEPVRNGSVVETVSGADVNNRDSVKVEFPVYQVVAEDGVSGTFGDNGGFSWNYDEATETLTVTGEDSGLNKLRSALPTTILNNMKRTIFYNCIVNGSLKFLLDSFVNVETVEFNNFDTSNVTDMSDMFADCHNLKMLTSLVLIPKM